MAIQNVTGLTMSYHHESTEMVIHVTREPDLRISSPSFRKQIFDTIKMFFATKTKSNLPIYGVRQKSLASYTTQQVDVAKGISRLPLPLARLADQDLVQINEMIAPKDQVLLTRLSSAEKDKPDFEAKELDRLEQLSKNLEQ